MKDHYSPIECIPSFFVVMCICLTNHVLFLLHRTIFCKKCLHKQFFLKMVELWDINIYFVWKTTIVPLSVCRVFFVVMCICLTNHVLFLLHRTIFCKKCLHKQFFLKMVELWDINIYFVWKTTIVLLSVCRVFCYNVYFAWQITFFFCSTGRYFVKNAYISNFFSKWWNSGI